MKKRQVNYDNDKEITAKRLREAMDEANITLTELAEKSKVSKSSISQYTHGLQSPSNVSAMAMAKVLDVSPVWLMGFDVPKDRVEYVTNDKDKMLLRLAAYTSYALPHRKIAKAYDDLPVEGKKEMLSYIDYLLTKYGVNGKEDK